MPASQEQKVDFLLKKIGYSVSKTGIAEDESTIPGSPSNTRKFPFEEGIPSPLVIPESSILADSGYIPTTPPNSDTAYVKVYPTSSALRMTADSTIGTNKRTYIAYTTYNDTSSARLTNWIDTQFGSNYIIKVFKNDATVPANELTQVGGNNQTDGWFFDYSSGVLNFNGVNLPSHTDIYIVGYRYIGAIGVRPPAGIGTFEHLFVAGVSTFMGSIDANSNLDVAGLSTFKSDVHLLDNDKLRIGGSVGTVDGLDIYHDTTDSYIDNNKGDLYIETTGSGDDIISRSADDFIVYTAGGKHAIHAIGDGQVELWFNNVEKFSTTGYGATVFGTTETQKLNVTGISTFGGNVDANGIIEGIAGQNKIPSLYSNYSDLPNAGTYHGMFAHVHEHQKGYFAHAGGWYELVNKETTGIVGTGTERYHIGSLNVTGITTLGSIGISTGRITGPAITYIDPATVGDDTGTLVVKGNLQVEGTQTVVNSSTMTVADKNIELAKGAANDAAVDGAGITIDSAAGDKTWQWVDATDSWTSSEHIRVAAGKVFGFANDPNSYIDGDGNDTINFTTDGQNRLKIDSNGDVIIGSGGVWSYPKPLNVQGSSGLTLSLSNFDTTTYAANTFAGIELKLRTGNTGTTDATCEIRAFKQNGTNGNSARGLSFYTGVTGGANIERLRITDTGNIGIGLTQPINPGHKTVHIHESASGESVRIHMTTVGTGATAGDGFSLSVDGDNKDVNLIQRESADMRFYTAEAEKLRITSGGSVGIGSTIPAAKLDVNGTSQFQDDITILGTNPSVSANKIIFDKSNNQLTFFDSTKANFGQSGDLQIYHQFGISYIDCTNSYQLLIQSDDLHIRNAAGNQEIITTAVNDSVQLYYSGSQKFTTTNTGVSITGITTTTQLEVGTLGQSLVGITTILDEDNFASDSATALATQQSIKAYVDGGASPASSLAVSADTGSNESINLVTEVLDIEGTANEIETATGTNKVVIGLPNNVTIGNKLTVTGDVGIGASLNVVGLSTFQDDVTINKDKDLIFDRFGVTKTRIRYNDTLVTTQIYNSSESLEIGYRPTHLMWLTNRVLSTKLGGVNITGDTETDTLNVSGDSTFTGGATFNGSISAGSTTGVDGYYLKSTGIGVTWAVLPSSRTGLTTTATAGQTSFNFSYNVGFVDVFLNGVKLPSTEFTASNGSTIVLDDAAFANDTLEFISLNTVPVSTAGAANLDGLADVTITGTPIRGETLQHNGTRFVNDYSPHTTTNSTNDTFIAGFLNTDYRSAEYLMQIRDETASPDRFHLTKLLIIHDGTNVYFNEYGTIFSHSSLATFTVVMNGSNVQVRATPASGNTMVFKYKFTGIKDAP